MVIPTPAVPNDRKEVTALDEISVFTLLLAQNLFLQCIKDARLFWPAAWPHLLITGPLAAAICVCHVAATNTAVVGLALSALLVLGTHGSQSNHVLLEATVVMGVIFTAPLPFGRTSATAADDERREWTARLAASLRAVMIVLYGVAAFAKFNDGWFDPQYSCSVLMAACALGDLMPLSPGLLRLMPVMALAFEVSMPLVILGAELAELYGPYESERLAQLVRTVRRVCVLLGSIFHIVIALPPPPVSVYPFSMLMAPIFVGLVPAECAAAARAAKHAPRRVKAAALALLAALVAAACHGASQSDHFEYPPYFSWELGCLWVVLAFSGLSLAALLALPASEHVATVQRNVTEERPGRRSRSTKLPIQMGIQMGARQMGIQMGARQMGIQMGARRMGIQMGACRRLLTLLPAVMLLAVGVAPYIGIRTHPALAMFSNLRIEGGASNHWLIRGHQRSSEVIEGGASNHWLMGQGAGLGARAAAKNASSSSAAAHDVLLSGYGPEVAIEIVETDLLTLRDVQVNLAPLLPASTLATLRRLGLASEFYISPPAWGHPPTEPFRPFAVPLVEVRLRIARAAAQGLDFFVKYRRVGGDGLPGHWAATRVYRRRKGKRTAGSDAALDEPVPALRAVLHRYRTFDTSYAPCRH